MLGVWLGWLLVLCILLPILFVRYLVWPIIHKCIIFISLPILLPVVLVFDWYYRRKYRS